MVQHSSCVLGRCYSPSRIQCFSLSFLIGLESGDSIFYVGFLEVGDLACSLFHAWFTWRTRRHGAFRPHTFRMSGDTKPSLLNAGGMEPSFLNARRLSRPISGDVIISESSSFFFSSILIYSGGFHFSYFEFWTTWYCLSSILITWLLHSHLLTKSSKTFSNNNNI